MENGYFIEFSEEVKASAQYWRRIWSQTLSFQSLPPLPPLKLFKPKFPLLETLDNYQVTAPSWFWNTFPSNLLQPAVPLINADEFRSLALSARYPDRRALDKAYKDLKYGAKIGCRSEFRAPSKSTNAPSALGNGRQVTDSIADWISKGFVYGPIPMDQVPSSAKFSGLMTRPKPNGSVRIILNLSAPMGSCVNEGISKDDFPTSMSSTSDWLRSLHKAGRRARFCKIDWADAYKHITVHPEDTDLQWFEWGGMGFKELCLIFGGVSSAGIFDRVNKIVIYIVCSLTKMDQDFVCQVLDDCCAAGPEHLNIIDTFDRTFLEVASNLGIKLAPRDDPEKSFAPCQKGIVLGVEYDSVSWTWSLPKDKLCRLLHLIREASVSDFFLQESMWSLAGKIINIKPLVPSGKFNVNHILKASSFSTNRTAMVPVSVNLKRQLFFWFTMLQVCDGRGTLRNPDSTLPPWAVDVYTDASGGSGRSLGHGAGAVTQCWWSYVPWSKAINLGHTGPNGKSLARSMSALELVGPLLAISSGYAWSKNNSVRIWVDNAGSVFIWKKGYSNCCDLSTTLVKAIATVAAGLGCNVDLVKITRCSTLLAILADSLSKGAFSRFWECARSNSDLNLPVSAGWVPSTLLLWLNNPVLDEDLGHKILLQLSERTLVLGYNC